MAQQFMFMGNTWTFEKFAEYIRGEEPGLTDEDIKGFIDELEEQGKLVWKKSADEIKREAFNKIMDKMANKTAIKEEVALRKQEVVDMANERRQALIEDEGEELRTGSFEFIERDKAVDFANWGSQEIQNQAVMTTKGGKFLVQFMYITQDEFYTLNKRYKTMSTVSTVTNAVGNVGDNVIDVVEGVGKDVVAPVAQIAGKIATTSAGVIFRTGARVGGSLFNNIKNEVKRTKEDLETDSQILEARNSVLSAKNSIARKWANRGQKIGGGASFE